MRRSMVLPERIELSTSPLPRECSTTELRQRANEEGRLLPQRGPMRKLEKPTLFRGLHFRLEREPQRGPDFHERGAQGMDVGVRMEGARRDAQALRAAGHGG